MAAATETALFDVDDFKVYALTDDTGACPTYGAAVDVWGIAEVGLDPNVITAELKGDGKLLIKRGKIDRLKLSFTYGRLSLPAMAVMIGTTTSAPSANQARGRLLANVQLPTFKAAFHVTDNDNGIDDVLVTLYKCQITGGTLLGQSTDNFGQPKFDLEAYGLLSTNAAFTDVIADMDLYTVATPLPA
jgi:hypothetical protein